MRLVTFTHAGHTRIGRLIGDEVLDLHSANDKLPLDMLSFLEGGAEAMESARSTQAGVLLPLEGVKLCSPVLRPPKILAIGLNYRDHLEESIKGRPGFKAPEVPVIFNKQSTSVNGPYDPVYLPPESEQLDYEAELAVIVGKRARRVPRQQAMQVIAGSTVCNDFSVRDWQARSPTMTMGKSWDTHCPLGPALVTLDEVDPTQLDFFCTVNGEVRQRSNTRELLFDIAELLEHLSTVFTLEPGDVIVTGTTSGVARWMPDQPWLRAGDVVRVEMEQLGHIENRIVAEAAQPQID